MRRAAAERAQTISTWRQHLATHTSEILCICEFQSGRFRKSQRVGGCGKSRCWLCHRVKLEKLATPGEQRAFVAFIEGMIDIGASPVLRPRPRRRR
jgi:hypothetical protein